MQQHDDTQSECCCSICWEPIRDPSVQLACKHRYHYDCITEWAKRNTDCPMCRQTFTSVQPSQPWTEQDVDVDINNAQLLSAVVSSITVLRVAALFCPNFVENLFRTQITIGRRFTSICKRYEYAVPTAVAMLLIASI